MSEQTGNSTAKDLIDIIQQASMKTELITDENGQIQSVTSLDSEIIWFKTLSVASPTFGRMAFELKEFERQALEATSNMPRERADLIAHQIIEIGASYRRSVDSKSSESMGTKDHAQSTLLDKINKNKIEKVHTFRGEMKKSMMDVFLGKEKESAVDED